MTSLAEEVLACARRIAAALRPPPVARVFLPTHVGPQHHASFCAVELADGSTGLCYVMLGDTAERLRAIDAAQLSGRDVLPLAEGFVGGDQASRSVGLAAVNALTRHLLDRARFQPDFATSSLGSLPLGPGDRLGMVGYFPPLVRRAREAGIPLTVVELKSELVQEAPGLTVTLDPARLDECSKIVCTSTTLLNASLDALLEHGRAAREFVIIGPSAGCVPDPLFARGVTGLGGAWVSDAATLLSCAERGERWGDATRKFSLRREGWPGLDALVERAARATPSP